MNICIIIPNLSLSRNDLEHFISWKLVVVCMVEISPYTEGDQTEKMIYTAGMKQSCIVQISFAYNRIPLSKQFFHLLQFIALVFGDDTPL